MYILIIDLECNSARYFLIWTPPIHAVLWNQPFFSKKVLFLVLLLRFWGRTFSCFPDIFTIILNPNPVTVLFGLFQENVKLKALEMSNVLHFVHCWLEDLQVLVGNYRLLKRVVRGFF